MQTLHHIDLAPWHTLRAHAEADVLHIIEHPDELPALPRDAFILGGGSNVIFAGHITRPLAHCTFRGRSVVAENATTISYRAAAGERWNDIVRECAEAGWYGLENLALIPGSIGAAPVQNIGAYGVEVGNIIDHLDVYDRHSGENHCLSAADCGFAYRHSRFKSDWHERYLITHVTFTLQKHGHLHSTYPDLARLDPPPDNPLALYRAVAAIRQRKLPDPAKLPNAGSFFHNPIVSAAQAAALKTRWPDMPQYPLSSDRIKLSAAWCIEQCGYKGQFDGAVGMYEGHALVLINRGGSGADILRYAARVQADVRARFGVALVIEPTILGANHA